MTTLTRANHEWSTRPADERFSSIEALHVNALASRMSAKTSCIAYADLKAVAHGEDILIAGKTGREAALTDWSFSQLAQRAGAPAGYLQKLPASLAVDCVNHGLAARAAETALGASETAAEAHLLFSNGGETLRTRALTSGRYSRIWDADITSRLQDMQSEGWNPAPAAYDGSRGLYRGSRSMFAFLVDNDRRIFERAPGGGLSRGFMIGNSEVGAMSLWASAFTYNYVCGNHMVWGAQDVVEIKVRHVGDVSQTLNEIAVQLVKYRDGSSAGTEAQIERARSFQIAATKEEVIDAVLALRNPVLGKKLVSAAYDRAEVHADWYGSPRSAWGMTSGLTEIARDYPNADDRVALEVASGKVMELAF